MTRRASCCCGACSIEIEGEPEINAICHCTDCKKRTGSAFGWSSYFADDRVLKKTGDVRCYEIESANRQQRWFCAACGSTLYWKAAVRPGKTGIAGGCFVDSPLPAPCVTVSNAGRCDWLGVPQDWATSI